MDGALGASDPVGAGEVRAFVERVAPEVYRYLIRLTGGDRQLSEDLVQEACLALFREVRAREAFTVQPGWMIVVARRRYLDHLRRARREMDRVERAAHEHAAGASPDPSSPPIGEEVLAALDALGADQRAALVLRYIDDLSVAEISVHLDRSVDATKSLLARARQQLSSLLSEAGHG